jgi:hypothetical protein
MSRVCCVEVRVVILRGQADFAESATAVDRASLEVTTTAAGNRERPQARAKRRPRSAVTSGRKLLLAGDPNSAWSRRYHDILGGHVADLGGSDYLSEAQSALCRDAACLEIELERMRGMLSTGEKVDLDLYGRIAGQRRRILETLGLERRSRDVTTLATYLAARPTAEPAGEGLELTASPVNAALGSACTEIPKHNGKFPR